MNNWLIPNWQAPANIHAAMTLRSGGFSVGEYDSFNLALHVGDDENAVLKNRALLKQALDLPYDPVWLTQTHSKIVVNADKTAPFTEADASYTNQANVVCAVMTADCLPVLMCSNDGLEIAAIHAGWKGLQAGIISNTLEKFQNKNVCVWLGAAIGANSFEVGLDVYHAFVDNNPAFATAFNAKNSEKFLADIYQLAKIELVERGVFNVVGGEYCTYSEPDKFYSYRRNAQTGRMATLIWRTENP